MSDQVRTAKITFDENDSPRSTDFGDIYFSPEDGLAESAYVFLQGARVRTRWRDRKQFCIAETGFGTGLNFLTSWQAWRDDPQRAARLDFFSIEKHPLSKADLARALAPWASLAALSTELVRAYPLPTSGFHCLGFDSGRVRLTLAFFDIQAALAQMTYQADAWYLDGFAPSKNPEMWSDRVLAGVYQHSRSDARITTFTAASAVRRGLQKAGFKITTCKGFGRKREMLVASKPEIAAATTLKAAQAPWFTPNAARASSKAYVVGAGLAGAQIAHALAERGWQVTVGDQANAVATGASGNRWGVLAPKFTTENSLGERFYLSAWQAQLRQLKRLAPHGDEALFQPCGLVQLAYNAREQKRMHALPNRFSETIVRPVSQSEISALAGVASAYDGYYIPQAAAVSPRHLAHKLLAHPLISVELGTRLKGDSSADLLAFKNAQGADILVIATGINLAEYLNSNVSPDISCLPVIPARGQSSAGISTPLPRTMLGHEGYLIPEPSSQDGARVVFGATFERGNRDDRLHDIDTTKNLASVQQYWSGLSIKDASSNHAGIRATTPDRFPIVGALPDWQWFQAQYADLHTGKQHQHYPPAEYLPDVYLLGGLGARGITTSAYCADMLAAEINDEPLRVEHANRHALHPARFLVRSLKRGHTKTGAA